MTLSEQECRVMIRTMIETYVDIAKEQKQIIDMNDGLDSLAYYNRVVLRKAKKEESLTKLLDFSKI